MHFSRQNGWFGDRAEAAAADRTRNVSKDKEKKNSSEFEF